MMRNTFSRLMLPALLTASLVIPAAPAAAGPPARGGGGGYHGGGYYGGYRGAVGGSHYNYHPNYGTNYYHGYRPYNGYHYRPYYGLGYYPYGYGYGYGYYPYLNSYPTGDLYLGSIPAVDSVTADPFIPAGGTINPSPSVPGSQTSTDSPARITVRLPSDAELWFGTTRMTTTGSVRVFSSPPLTPGQRYTYEIRAHWTDNNGSFDQKQTVIVTAGTDLDVNFPVPEETGEKSAGAATPADGR